MKKPDRSVEKPAFFKGKLVRIATLAVVAVAAVFLLIFEVAKPTFTEDELLNGFYTMTLTRFIGALVFFVLIGYEGYRVLNPVRNPFGKSFLIALPAFLVAVNNFPFIALISGNAHAAYGGWYIFWCALECVAVGLFEEAAFRGILLLMICHKKRATTLNLFVSIVLSSVIFGVVHMANLLVSGGLGGVLQQIGYSTLIGAMCAVVLYKTANIWLCVMIHAIFNFGGRFYSLLGGKVWDNPTVVITVVLALAVAAYMITVLFTMDPRELDRIYQKGTDTFDGLRLPDDLKSRRVRFILKRAIPCAILCVIVSVVLIVWGERMFFPNNLPLRIVCYVAVSLIPFLATGVPFEFMDHTFLGTVKKVTVSTVAEHDALTKPQRAHVYTTKNLIRLTVETPDGRIVRKVVSAGNADAGVDPNAYCEGDVVFHLYGSHHTVVLPSKSDAAVACSVCGVSNQATGNTCRKCGHTLIVSSEQFNRVKPE